MSSFTKSLFRLTVVTFVCVMLIPVSTTRAGPPDVSGCHLDHKDCVVDERDEPTSTFEVQFTIEGLEVNCGDPNCKSKPIRIDRLDRTSSLVVRGMDMTIPLQGFLARQFMTDACFGLDMPVDVAIFEPRASRGTISVQISFKALDTTGKLEQEYGFNMSCEIPKDATWVPDDVEAPVTVTLKCQNWSLSSRGSLDRCEQETQVPFSVLKESPTKIEVSGPTLVPVN